MDSNPYNSQSTVALDTSTTSSLRTAALWLIAAAAIVAFLWGAAMTLDAISGVTAERISVWLFHVSYYAAHILLGITVVIFVWTVLFGGPTWWLLFALLCIIGEIVVMRVIIQLSIRYG